VLEVVCPAHLTYLDSDLQARVRACLLLESLQALLTYLLTQLCRPAIEKTNRQVNKTLTRLTFANKKVTNLSPPALAATDGDTSLGSKKRMHSCHQAR
jgi:hypothetical protein